MDWTGEIEWWTDMHFLMRLTCLWSCVEPCSLLSSYTDVLANNVLGVQY